MGVPEVTATITPINRANWRASGACRDADPGLFFGPDEEPPDARAARESEAVAICHSCPLHVRAACLSFAIKTSTKHGVFGGTGEDARDRHARNLRDRARKTALLENAS